MKIMKLAIAAALAIGAFSVPATPADAQQRWGHNDRGRHMMRGHDRDRHWRGNRGRHRGWSNRRVCRTFWRHHRRQRVCSMVRYRR